MRLIFTILILFTVHFTFGQIKIHIPEPYGTNFIESELIAEVTYVPLEIEDYGMITPDMEMKVYDENYFILDNKNSQCIYRFGSGGELLNKIYDKSKSMSDENIPVLNNPLKFSINPYRQQIDIYNFEDSKILKYNFEGKITGEFDFEIAPSDFVCDLNSNYWIYTGWNNYDTQYRLLKTDSKGRILDRKMRLVSRCKPIEGFSFYAADDKICLWELLGNAVYTITDSQIKPTFIFDYGIFNLPQNYHNIEGDESFISISRTGYYTIKKYIENDNFAYFFLNFDVEQQHEMFHVIHDKKTSQTLIYAENSAIGAFDKAQYISADNELVFLVSPRKIRQLLRSGTEFVPAPFSSLLDELKPLRNPIVLKLKLSSIDDITPEIETNDSLYFEN